MNSFLSDPVAYVGRKLVKTWSLCMGVDEFWLSLFIINCVYIFSISTYWQNCKLLKGGYTLKDMSRS